MVYMTGYQETLIDTGVKLPAVPGASLHFPQVRDPGAIRRANRSDILRTVRWYGPLTRSQISDILDLGSATVFAIVQQLLEMQLLQEDSIGVSTGGRRPTLYSFNPRAFFAIGVDVGGLGKIRAVLTDLDGNTLFQNNQEVPVNSGPDIVVPCIVRAVEQIILESGLPRDVIGGIGIAMMGFIDIAKGVVVFDVNKIWINVPLADLIHQHTGLPTQVVNHSSAIALAEKWCGAGRLLDTFVTVNIGVGVGVGMILGGKLYTGPTNKAGQLGHNVVVDNGPLCTCGKRGCLLALAGGQYIAQQAMHDLRLGAASRVLELAGGDINQVTAMLVAEAAACGDPYAVQLIQTAGRYLGIAISWLINLLNPQAVLVGGNLAQAGEVLFAAIRGSVEARVLPEVAEGVQIIEVGLGANARPIGAAIIVLERLMARL
jgi:predicted NBD/HSP70 family sugar kinase